MRFVDQAKIVLRGGDGGKGVVAFRREKYVPFGGPSGGDGGKGGDLILEADRGLKTLLDLQARPRYEAERGQHGQGKDRHGKSGRDLVVRVPVGTLVRLAETGEELVDLVEEKQRYLVARGGDGGKGNARFTTPTRQAPDFAEPGHKGEERCVELELKLLADVGIVGFPNTGKSTLISRVSRATPKIADYPFTTLVPNLGVASLEGWTTLVLADVPGLIPGAHEGAGLGLRFLRHVERTRVFCHMIDLGEEEGRGPVADFDAIREEMRLYDEEHGTDLIARPLVVVLNKIDVTEVREAMEACRAAMEERGREFHAISAATGEGVDELLRRLARLAAEDGG